MARNDKTKARSFKHTRTRHRGLGYIGIHNECIPLISHFSQQIDNISQIECLNMNISYQQERAKRNAASKNIYNHYMAIAINC